MACAVAFAALAAAMSAVPAGAQELPYRTNDFGGFRNILPPGQNGLLNAPGLAGYLAGGKRPPNSSDQLRMYQDLVYSAPTLTAGQIGNFFKDASFGVPPGQVARRYKPRNDVVILRDRQFGVPHIYGSTRAGTMYGLGYAGAEDRLFFMDVLRNAGAGRLSSFAGGAAGNRAMDRDSWNAAAYKPEEYQRQIDVADDVLGSRGKRLQEDAKNYTAGINAYIRAARVNPLLMPAEYAAIGKLGGPERWKTGDLVATAALIAGIFGKGGGSELASAQLLQSARSRFGRRRGTKVWRDFRTAEEPTAPTTVFRDKVFPYQRPPKRTRRGSVALPDPGSLERSSVVSSSAGSTRSAARSGILGGLANLPKGASNALLVSARESESGRPEVVFGPQVGYFSPQILYEVDAHGPGIDARGATFPGVGLYILLGRGRDYAWSATSAGQDIVDTFAVPLCEPGGGSPTTRSKYYSYRGRCLRIETLLRRNSWKPSLGDSTPAGTEVLRKERTKLGLVSARGTVKGKPVVFTSLRSTYMHEADGALGFEGFNDPNQIKSARDFQKAASKINYTFNWFYTDDRDIAYFNSGNNPVRARGINNNFPVAGRFEWRDYNPDANTARYTPFSQHPQTINQRYITSWNNKQARGFRAADGEFSYGTIYRSETLSDRIRAELRGGGKVNLQELIRAMETAGSVDLRGDKVLPFLLKALGRSSDPRIQRAIDLLQAWKRDGTLRRDLDRNGSYENSQAIAIMDAWWPRLLEQIYKPVVGSNFYNRLGGLIDQDDEPNNGGGHLGSSYISGWYGYVEKDVRTILGRRLRRSQRVRKSNRYSRTYCGGPGRKRTRLRRCRGVLERSLSDALARTGFTELYGKDDACSSGENLPPGQARGSLQLCFDAIRFRPTGAVEQPLIHWINRPTFQQAVEVKGHRGR